jgi:hypothetical protein
MSSIRSMKEVLEDKDVRDILRGVIAYGIYIMKDEGSMILSVPGSFDRADKFIDEWIKRSK